MAQYKENHHETKYLYFLSRLYIIIILAVYPLYVGFAEYKYDDIVHSKAVAFWSTSIIFFAVFALFYLAYILGFKKVDRPLPFWKTFTIPDWAALAFLLTLTISFLLSPYKEIAWYGTANRNDGYLTYLCMIVAYFILSRWYKPKWADMVLFSVGSALVCIIGFLQFYGYDFLNLFPYNRYSYSGFTIFFRSTIGNVNFVSAYVSVAIIVFGALYVKTQNNIRFLYLTTSIMNFMLMIIAGSRSGIMGIIGAFAFLIAYFLSGKNSFGKLLILFSSFGLAYIMHHFTMIKFTIPYWQQNKELFFSDTGFFEKYLNFSLVPILIASLMLLGIGMFLISRKFNIWPKPKTAQIAGFCALGLIILIGFTGIEIIGNKLPESHAISQAREIMHGNIQDDFGSSRIYTWRKALERFSNGQPLFGTGSDTFYQAFGIENQQESKNSYGVAFDKAHNDFIQILLCNGVFGLISYLALIFSIVILSVKKAFYDNFLLAALGGALAYIIQSFFNIDTVIVTPIYWIMLSIVRQRQTEASATPDAI